MSYNIRPECDYGHDIEENMHFKKVELSFSCVDAVSSSSVKIWSTSLCDVCTVFGQIYAP